MRGGFYPFWFWNGDLEAGEIRWQIQEMADKGVRGFFIHSRQGLVQPYLSRSFLDMVQVAVDAAQERGLVVQLYDEYPYPSGIAGGEVVLGNPHYYATRLVQRSHTVEGGRVRVELPKGKVLSCVAFPCRDGGTAWEEGIDLRPEIGMHLGLDSFVETGLTRYNRKRYFASDPTPVLETTLPAGSYRLIVSVQAEVNHFKYWDRYVDVLNPDAVRHFIELTHERYRARLGEHLGGAIQSIYVDETCPHWSERIPAAFLAEYGYDLLEMLPALQAEDHPEALRVAYDLDRLVYKLFCASFEEPVSTWCREHGLAYAGEKASLRMAQLRYMDIPGCDPGHVKVGARLDLLGGPLRRNAKSTASAAYFYGKQGALCECYHSMGWSATLQDAKYVAEGLLLLGITYLVPHGFFYSTHALTKHDAPPSFFFQMPFWPRYGALSERLGRVWDLFKGTHIDAELLVVDPASGLPTDDDLQGYADILWALMENHLDYHVVDTDILEGGQIEGGRVHVADVRAGAVLVPPMRVIEPPLKAWLERFRAAGGQVLICERGQPLAQIVPALKRMVQPSLSIRADGQEAGACWSVKRSAPGRALWFVLNTGGETLRVELACGSPLREVSLGDLPASLEGEGGRAWRTVYPFESFVVEAAAAAVPAEPLPRVRVPVGGPARLRLHDRNLLRLGEWEMALIEGGQPIQRARVRALPLANQLAQGGFRFAPAFRFYFGHGPELDFPELRVRYEARFQNAFEGPVQLVMEPGSIVGEWQISVNGSEPIRAEDLAPAAAHVRGSLGVDVTASLRAGENALTVEVVTGRSDGGLLNPLYLAGDFGVTLEPWGLVPLRSEGAFEAYEANLLPYYAGTIEYTTTFVLDRVPEGEQAIVELAYEGPFHEATEVSINGSTYTPVLWQPRHVRVDAASLVRGENTLHTRVYTTLIRPFEGQRFDYQAHEYRDIC